MNSLRYSFFKKYNFILWLWLVQNNLEYILANSISLVIHFAFSKFNLGPIILFNPFFVWKLFIKSNVN